MPIDKIVPTDKQTNEVAPDAPENWEQLKNHRYDEVCWICSHNAFAARNSGWTYYQQNLTIEEQLEMGVRAFMIDAHLDNGVAVVAHGQNLQALWRVQEPLGSKPLSDTLKIFKKFLDDNPNAIITIIFETYDILPNTMQQVYNEGLGSSWPYLYKKCDLLSKPWSTLEQMVNEGQRLVVFSNGHDGNPESKNHAMENRFGADSMNLDEALSRHKFDNGNHKPLGSDLCKPLFVMNYAYTFHLGMVTPFAGLSTLAALATFPLPIIGSTITPLLILSSAAIAPTIAAAYSQIGGDMDAYKILAKVHRCFLEAKRYPNFIATDFVEVGNNGGVSRLVQIINGTYLPQPPSDLHNITSTDLIDSANRNHLKDGDRVYVLSQAKSPKSSDKVKIVIDRGSTWDKEIVLRNRINGETKRICKTSDENPEAEGTIDLSEVIMDGILMADIIIYKAKIAGVMTQMYCMTDTYDALLNRTEFKLQWISDSPAPRQPEPPNGLHHITFNDLKNSERNKLQDWDRVKVSCKRNNSLSGDKVKLVIDRGHTWDKELVLRDRFTGRTKIICKTSDANKTVSGTIDVSELKIDNIIIGDIIIYKAKTAGVMTQMYCLTDAYSSLHGGHEYKFGWISD